MGGIGQIIDQFINQLIGIPLEGPLSYVYVILNLLALLIAPSLGEWLVSE